MSGIAIAALTMPGNVAPLATCSSDASVRIDSIRWSSATTRPGTRVPRPGSCGTRQSNGPTPTGPPPPSSCAARGRRGGAAARPGHSGHRHEHADDARELRHADRAEPEAVEPEHLDGEAPDRVETDVCEEQRPRARPEPRA